MPPHLGSSKDVSTIFRDTLMSFFGAEKVIFSTFAAKSNFQCIGNSPKITKAFFKDAKICVNFELGVNKEPIRILKLFYKNYSFRVYERP